MVGANTGKLKSTTASNAEKPAGLGILTRIEREWKVTKTNYSDNFNMNIKLAPGASPGSVTVANLRLLVDTDGDFSNGGTTSYSNGDGSGITFTYSNPLITITGISSTHIANNGTSYITVASVSGATPLPVELISFNGTKQKGYNDLSWTTATEINNDYFSLKKMADSSEFKEIGVIKGAGNSTAVIHYNYIDPAPMAVINYYRLKQTDYNGTESYSTTISIDNRKIEGDKEIVLITNILGQEVNEYYRGVVIVDFSDGSSMKIIR